MKEELLKLDKNSLVNEIISLRSYVSALKNELDSEKVKYEQLSKQVRETESNIELIGLIKVKGILEQAIKERS